MYFYDIYSFIQFTHNEMLNKKKKKKKIILVKKYINKCNINIKINLLMIFEIYVQIINQSLTVLHYCCALIYCIRKLLRIKASAE